LAYLELRNGEAADKEFQKILSNPGLVGLSVIYPISHVGLARASALRGDASSARKAYEDFFALWKEADPDIPILIQAKNEYAKLGAQP
jgi:hypothetical protein